MIEFREIEGIPSELILKTIETIGTSVFEGMFFDEFRERINNSVNLLTILALDKDEIVGFKMGYQIHEKKFYSWLGGVDKNYRKQGIADELMRLQHNWCKEKGFETVQTKTKNCFKPMLILNIKNGFDIVETYLGKKGEFKIVLEKAL